MSKKGSLGLSGGGFKSLLRCVCVWGGWDITQLLDSVIACLNDNVAAVVDCQQNHMQILMSILTFNQPAVEMC